MQKQKVYWLCKEGHTYQKLVAKRTKQGQGCPQCRIEKNAFAYVHPELVQFWDYALVRANYNDLKNGIHGTTEYLEMFLRNLLLDEKHELHNRAMHISGVFEPKVDIENNNDRHAKGAHE